MSDVTWTKDGNLLGTWIASSSDSDGNGTLDIIDAIIAASPTISNTPNYFSPTGIYTITASDFFGGQTSWFGAMAYVNYLNRINYAGSSHWYLPTAVHTGAYAFNMFTNGTAKGDELVELYYQELSSKAVFDKNGNYQPDYGIKDPNNIFDNVQSYYYWSGTDLTELADPNFAWVFGTDGGLASNSTKHNLFFAWAVSPGQVAAVPEPESVAMLLLGLGVVGFASRRRRG